MAGLLIGALMPAVAAAGTPMCQGLEVTIAGTDGPDVLRGTMGPDVIHGFGGDDVIRGRGGDDVICGGPGNDNIRGGAGDDIIQGGDGNDVVEGGSGNDLLFGSSGADTLVGGRGNDTIVGGAGEDFCDGGTGIDEARGCESPVRTEIGNRPPVRTRPGSTSVAFTFDDGPHPVWTPMVLDVLKRYRVKATFFVVGSKAQQYPGLIRRMIREGHSVQNHTYSHAWLTGCSDAVASLEISRGCDVIEAAAGVQPRCLRPPFGAINSRIESISTRERQAIVMWDVDPQDWRYPSTSWVVAHVTSRTEGGDIVLFHDGSGPTAARALPRIIEILRGRGLTFSSICG